MKTRIEEAAEVHATQMRGDDRSDVSDKVNFELMKQAFRAGAEFMQGEVDKLKVQNEIMKKPSFISGAIVEGETLKEFSKQFNYIPGKIALSRTQFKRILIDIGLSEKAIKKELEIFDEKPGVENGL
jgi:hypothetical protein